MNRDSVECTLLVAVKVRLSQGSFAQVIDVAFLPRAPPSEHLILQSARTHIKVVSLMQNAS